MKEATLEAIWLALQIYIFAIMGVAYAVLAAMYIDRVRVPRWASDGALLLLVGLGVLAVLANMKATDQEEKNED